MRVKCESCGNDGILTLYESRILTVVWYYFKCEGCEVDCELGTVSKQGEIERYESYPFNWNDTSLLYVRSFMEEAQSYQVRKHAKD